jgi:hypothetical protein
MTPARFAQHRQPAELTATSAEDNRADRFA